jgi:hypothetical protein
LDTTRGGWRVKILITSCKIQCSSIEGPFVFIVATLRKVNATVVTYINLNIMMAVQPVLLL